MRYNTGVTVLNVNRLDRTLAKTFVTVLASRRFCINGLEWIHWIISRFLVGVQMVFNNIQHNARIGNVIHLSIDRDIGAILTLSLTQGSPQFDLVF